jgi:peroxiredoxin
MKRSFSAVLAAAFLVLGGWTAVAAQDNTAAEEAKLLPIGQVAPDFTLPLVNGGEVTLANILKVSKAAVVTFFSIKPERGGTDLPKLQKLQEDLEAKGLMTVAVNPVELQGAIKRYAEAQSLHFLIAIDGKETNRAVTGVYKARVLPTYYLLDAQGKVLYRSVGLREAELREAIAKAGIK